MSDTPETDANSPWRYSITSPDGTTTLFVPADFARKLERQRDEAKRKVTELQAGLDDIEEYGTEEINAAVDLRHQLAAALCERNEAREAIRAALAEKWLLDPQCDEDQAIVDRLKEEAAK